MKKFIVVLGALTGCALMGIMPFAASSAQPAADEAKKGADEPKKAAGQGFPEKTLEHKALEIWVGEWEITGNTYKGSPYGEGKFTGKNHVELMNGGLFLVAYTQYDEHFKNTSTISFLGVDPKTKEYTFSLYSNLGIELHTVGKPKDNTKKTFVKNPIEWIDIKVNTELPGAVAPPSVYTTEVISADEIRFSMTRGKTVTYDGVSKRVKPTVDTKLDDVLREIRELRREVKELREKR